MIPKTFSATALQTAEGCLSRYYHEINQRAPQESNVAADLGTVVHAALEAYVKAVHLDKEIPDELETLRSLYEISFRHIIGPDTGSVWYKDGLKMINGWWGRTSFEGVTVVSCEIKETFEIPTSLGKIPFTYILDRMDQIGEDEYKVVDYKTIRIPETPDSLREKIQPRAYALAAQIKFPQAKRIWVEFDLLRHERVGTVFTRDDNIATWEYLKHLAQKVVDTNPDAENKLPESINKDCRYCVRKARCETLNKNIASDGIFSFATVRDAVVNLNNVKDHIAALKAVQDQLQDIIVSEAEKQDTFGWAEGDWDVKLTAKKIRSTLPNEIAKIVEPAILADYSKMNVGDFDRMLDDPRISDSQKDELKKRCIQINVSAPIPDIKKRKVF